MLEFKTVKTCSHQRSQWGWICFVSLWADTGLAFFLLSSSSPVMLRRDLYCCYQLREKVTKSCLRYSFLLLLCCFFFRLKNRNYQNTVSHTADSTKPTCPFIAMSYCTRPLKTAETNTESRNGSGCCAIIILVLLIPMWHLLIAHLSINLSTHFKY